MAKCLNFWAVEFGMINPAYQISVILAQTHHHSQEKSRQPQAALIKMNRP
ncbi:hypothetical protein AO375_0142 [Moraxella catarrhalis]|nr:hypothetical protein AO375_0142 [Moraxella catarrhalis]